MARRENAAACRGATRTKQLDYPHPLPVANQIYHYDLLLNDMSELLLAGDPLVDPESFNIEVTSDPRHICSKILQDFMEKAIEEYLNLYRMVCQNRCRIRRTFTQAIPVLDARARV